MSESRSATTARVLTRGSLVGGVGSLLLHASSLLTLLVVTTPPPPVFELTFPIEVELGVTDPTEMTSGALPPEAGEGGGGGSGAGAGGSSIDAGVPIDGSIADGSIADGSVGDGGDGDAGRRRRRRDAGVDAGEALIASEEGTETGVGAGGGDSPVAFLPAGAQVALRADLDQARTSPVRAEIEALLSALPDWRILLGSDALEPVRDFSRVLIATPNFDRSRLVVAGRLSEGERTPREMADGLASARGTTLTWSEAAEGIPSAPWTVDATPRTLAIVGPRHFVVARDEDLPRVLAIAAARTGEGEPSAADALLSMEGREALSLEVEGARNFVRGGSAPCPVPDSLRIGMTARLDESGVDLEGVARFPDEDTARDAARCFDEIRETYASNFLVASMGLGRPLESLVIEADGRRMLAHGGLTYAELRHILSLVRSMFASRGRRGGAAGSTTGPAPPPPSGAGEPARETSPPPPIEPPPH